jgi:predicted small secreted protein
MKHILFIVLSLVLLAALVLAGCAVPPGPPAGEEVSNCVICHSDKDLLKETVAPVEEEVSEATSGEG